MTENVVDILIYLYENYMDSEPEIASDHTTIHDDLLQAGFPEGEIEKAFDWMDELVLRQGEQEYHHTTGHSVRIFTDSERGRLDAECRGFLLYLEQGGILDMASRELVIDRALALEQVEVGVEELKWITLMVLINQPGRESAFAQMESLVYNEVPAYLH